MLKFPEKQIRNAFFEARKLAEARAKLADGAAGAGQPAGAAGAARDWKAGGPVMASAVYYCAPN